MPCSTGRGQTASSFRTAWATSRTRSPGPTWEATPACVGRPQQRFPQFTGHGEHGFASAGKGLPKLDFKSCKRNGHWKLGSTRWANAGLRWYGGGKQTPFHFGHVCGSYDKTKKGVWELYLTDTKSKDGSMTPGVHFFGSEADQALENLDPWQRPRGIVGNRTDAGIHDTEWHHIAWQYNYAEDLHELFLDGRLIWKMHRPDGRKLVNNRNHDAQFSVSTRLTGYSRYGGGFNYLGKVTSSARSARSGSPTSAATDVDASGSDAGTLDGIGRPQNPVPVCSS
ncbi:MAG: hypothetical protein Ct9H300mP1_30230 [Planctomycetaceae bacterium]|nr:MAG: hypothetical protein Ct9H300mP1_30230 [Planctomycetaceae bacterium]